MMIHHLIFYKVNKLQLFILSFGAWVGFLFLSSTIYYFGEIKILTQGHETLAKNLVIAQKKVTKYSSFNENATIFSSAELEALKKHPAVLRMEPVINNQFSVSLSMREEGLPFFRTDIYIQAVSNDLLDVKIREWKWEVGAEFVPLIMPRDFMLMLNQFAASYKIPQVSEDIAKTLNFNLELRGNGQKMDFRAKIVGFSNQMNAVLVPMSFMNFGNSEFAQQKPDQISQLVLQFNEKKYGDFERVMDEMNLEIKENELLLIKIQGILFAVLSALFLVSIIIVGLCALLILQFSMLLLSESAYEINTLLLLGYHPNQLARKFLVFFAKRLTIVLILVIPGFIAIKVFVNDTMKQYGLLVSEPWQIGWSSIVGLSSLILISLGIIMFNHRSVLKQMKKAF
jgi:hypothetical protein